MRPKACGSSELRCEMHAREAGRRSDIGKAHGLILKLRWGSVDFNRRLVTVEGRNAKSCQTRHVPLNEQALSALRRWREQTGTGRIEALKITDWQGRL